jgi:pyridoxal phosphate enzyme (YggS family)
MSIEIADNIKTVKAALPEGVRLIAVSKYHPKEMIEEAYAAGQRLFGENKVQEMTAKYESLPKDIEWHFIGHLQTNKIKYIAPYVTMIHGIDSFRLLSEVNKYAAREGRKIRCLLQVHIAREETKFGFAPQELLDMLASEPWQELTNVEICGLMTMASNTDNMEQVKGEFADVKRLFDSVKQQWFASSDSFCELSMGMSHDFKLAVEAGSTMVRVGSLIFGERVY